jgi:hypothetical protein
LVGFALEHDSIMANGSNGAKTLPISELVKGTARLSPFEDFKTRTLSALSGPWAKLLYMAELLGKDLTYEHWGYSRRHGEACSQAALGKIHSEIYIEVLRTSIAELIPGEGSEGGQDRHNAESERIAAAGFKMIPKESNGGSTRHFNSVLLTVRLVSAERRASSHTTA